MKERKVWKVIDKNSIPKERRLIKCKWVWKIKRNGVYRARLVACGYSQIPGVDFFETYAPLVNDVTWRALLAIKIVNGFVSIIIDVETAFLHGEL